MATESAEPSKRPRPLLLVLLGLTIAAAVVMKLMGSASSGTPASNPSGSTRSPAQARPDAAGGKGGLIDPARLDVHLEVLQAERPSAAEAERNPFRFKPAPPPPAPPPVAGPAPSPNVPPAPTGPPPPPPPPPITVKFIGLLDLADGSRIAVFTDCSAGRRQSQAREGGTVDGRYRLVKIGRESVVIEHLDGRGRTTLAAGGQDCVK
jgi:hypothetical protein